MEKGFLQVAEYDKSGYCGFQVTSFKLQVGGKAGRQLEGQGAGVPRTFVGQVGRVGQVGLPAQTRELGKEMFLSSLFVRSVHAQLINSIF